MKSTASKHRHFPAASRSLVILAAATAALAAPLASGEVFRWINAYGGAFENPDNWEYNTEIDTTAGDYNWNSYNDRATGWTAASRCPGSADLALLSAVGEYTVTASGDIALTSLRSGNNAIATLDMGGHELVCSRALNSSGNIWDNGSFWRLLLTNGTFRCSTGYESWNTWKGFGSALGSNKNTERGRMVIAGPGTHAVTTGRAATFGTNSFFQVRDGATFLIEDNGRLEANAAGTNLVFSVTGAGSSYTAGHLSLGSQVNEIRDGATVTVSGIGLAGDSGIPVRLVVDNASIQGLSAGLNSSPPIYTGGRGTGAELLVSNRSVISVPTSANYLCVGFANGYASVSNRMVLASGSHLAATNAPLEMSRFQASCSELVVDDATVEVKDLIVGAYSNVRVGGVEYAGGGSNNVLRIAGAAPLVRCFGIIQTYGGNAYAGMSLNYHSTLRFDVPPAGWSSAPIVLDTGKFVSLREGAVPGCEALPNSLVVNARQWARDNPKSTITLVQAGRDSSEGFADLIANAKFDVDNPSLRPTLSVSADGMMLQLTAPSYPATMLIVR